MDVVLRRVIHRPWITLGLIALLLGIQVQWWWSPSEDGASYLSMARHFSQGEIGRFDSPHLHYAPGYPLLMAPAFWISDHPFLLISLMQLALAMALAGGVYLWFHSHVGVAAGWLTLLVMANVSLWEIYRFTLSEIAFMAGLVWSAHALHYLARSNTAWQTASRALLGIALLLVTCFTRQVGVFLVPGFAMTLALHAWRQQISWRRAVLLPALVGLPLAIALLASIMHEQAVAQQAGGSAKSYEQYFAVEGQSFAIQAIEGLRLRISELGRLTLPGMYKVYARQGQWLDPVIGIYLIATALLMAGWWAASRRRADALLLMFPFYAALYIVWPFDQGTRYMLPTLPVLVLGMWYALERLQRREAVIGGLLTLHLCGAVVYWVRDLPERHLNDQWPTMAAISRSIADDAGPVACMGLERPLYLMLLFESDRFFPLYATAEEIDPGVHRVITPRDMAPPAGYTTTAQVGSMAICQRDEEWSLAANSAPIHEQRAGAPAR